MSIFVAATLVRHWDPNILNCFWVTEACRVVAKITNCRVPSSGFNRGHTWNPYLAASLPGCSRGSTCPPRRCTSCWRAGSPGHDTSALPRSPLGTHHPLPGYPGALQRKIIKTIGYYPCMVCPWQTIQYAHCRCGLYIRKQLKQEGQMATALIAHAQMA